MSTASGRATPRGLAEKVRSIRAGQRAAIARAITELENGLPSAAALSAALESFAGRAQVVGVTGPPGAGKSTLVDALVRECVSRGRRVAVVAIDPSSPITGGAVLGDRIRMGAAGSDDAVFTRALASRGHAGGLARPVRRIVDLLDAAGFDEIVVETVGAGQSDVDIASLADASLVLCPPGLGDDVQAIKAGILEIADLLVVSKGDLPQAERAERDLKDMLHLRAPCEGWRTRVLRTSATTGEGIAALADALDTHRAEVGAGRRHARGASPAHADPQAELRGFGERDPWQQHTAIRFVEGGPGRATMSMRVGREHLNFNGKCHGGAIFSLADSAFGLASNSHGVVAVGIDTHATFELAVGEGDLLVARAIETSRSARIAVYRVDVTREDGSRVSSFTGTVYRTRRRHDGGAPEGAA